MSKEEKDARFEVELMPVISPLYNFAFRLTLDEDDANDLVQETYLKAYRFFDYFVIEKNGSFLMHQRSEGDIWTGLNDFYLVENDDKLSELDDINDSFLSEVLS